MCVCVCIKVKYLGISVGLLALRAIVVDPHNFIGNNVIVESET